MKKIIQILCLWACFSLLIGCASTVKPLAKNAVENKTFVLVPTGQISYEVVSNRTGGAFGLLGALIEAAVTQSSSAALQERLRESVPPEFMMQTATNQIEVDLKKYGNYRLVIAKDHTLKDLPYSEWSKNLKRDDLKGDLLANADVIVDVGMTNVSLIKALGGTYANLGVSIRFIDRNSGNMHGEVKEFTSSGVNSINFDLDEDSATYPADVKNAFERLIRKSVSTALEKVFDVPPSTQQAPQVNPAEKIVTPSVTQKPDPVTSKIVDIKQSDVIKQAPLPANSSDGAKRLVELKSLLDKGLVTQKDYDLKKQEILKSM
jgi:hypothetical protein